MNIEIEEINGKGIARIVSREVVIGNTQDAVELLMNCQYQGADAIIMRQEQLAAEFFELRTGIAGDILQKFSTYGSRLAIVGNFQDLESKSLRDFIRESNRVGRINFVSSEEEARAVLG